MHETEKDDEIALVSTPKRNGKKKEKKDPPAANALSSEDSTESALVAKGKGGKGVKKGKGHSTGNDRWSSTGWDSSWNNYNPPSNDSSYHSQWNSPSKGKGQGKGKGKVDHNQGSDQTHWCDIHQRYGHSTDWCFDNPSRSGGPAPRNDGLWCETCNRSGHTSNNCYASTVRPLTDKGKGKRQGNTSHYGNRQWKSQNFPANYNSDQAVPALHDESSSSSTQVWWEDHELGSAIMDNEPSSVPLHPDLLLDYIENNSYNDDDDEYVSEYIDLIIFAIITNITRYKHYVLNPTAALLAEIQKHSTYISRAESCLNIHIQRIIRNFKMTIQYDELMSGTSTTVEINTVQEQLHTLTSTHDSTNDEIKTAHDSTNDEIKTANEH